MRTSISIAAADGLAKREVSDTIRSLALQSLEAKCSVAGKAILPPPKEGDVHPHQSQIKPGSSADDQGSAIVHGRPP